MVIRNLAIAAAVIAIIGSTTAMAHEANFLHHHHQSFNHQMWVPGRYIWTPKYPYFSQEDDTYEKAQERCAQRYVTYDYNTDTYFPRPGVERLCKYVRPWH